MDKLYWRQAEYAVEGAALHCFKKRGCGVGYISLCEKHIRKRSGGQACKRPPALMRCAICDNREMDRRGWEESGPESPNWRD